jgi:hypothetical protein
MNCVTAVSDQPLAIGRQALADSYPLVAKRVPITQVFPSFRVHYRRRRTTNDERRTTNDGRRTTDDLRFTILDERKTPHATRHTGDNRPLTTDHSLESNAMPTHIFISHASADDEFVRDLRGALAGQGLIVWVDSRNLRGGDKLDAAITQAIETARQTLVVLSPHTINSLSARKEIRLALEVEQRRKDENYRVIPPHPARRRRDRSAHPRAFAQPTA